ncbi:UDP-glycosyltransferase 89B2-like [Cornus florida]|uniref:UDP-glycosyltransferase 89B2-like n=1 Tax=Cornus florida TaxID=4283 RepID=UPI00289ACE1E|nr:UDP-glycosyltransferase 89B2-like [Cornus florida]
MSTVAVGNCAHILVYPFPAPGHIIPLLDLTRLLLTHGGLTVTVLVTPEHLPLLQPLLSTHPSTSLQPLLLSHPPNSPNSSGLVAKVRATGDLYHPILQWFRSHPNPPVAIVSDFFLGWTTNLARELGVPRVVFWASGAFAASVLDFLWRHLPRNDEPHDDDNSIRLANVPNSPEYPWWQFPRYYRQYTKGNPDFEFFRSNILANMESWGIVFNSFTELERVYIDHVKKELLGNQRVWAVGPLLPPDDDAVGPGGRVNVPPHEVMTWLDGMADQSVVYVCFGSRGKLTSKQTKALVDAIEHSGVHFIWAVKATDKGRLADDDAGAILDEFEERVGPRGFVIRGWAPQVAILRHRAVGAFVTHCGWNSVMEGLAAGVVMLTWPMGTDQFTNAKLLVDQIGVAARACDGGAQSVPDSTELARLLAESVSETGPKRAQVVQLRDAALKAIAGGSSSIDLKDFLNRLTELQKQNTCD